MRKLSLFFLSNELVTVEFRIATGEVRRSVRGKSSGAKPAAGSFQWTSAVKGFALLATRTAAHFRPAVLEGNAKSLAASLDYAITKQPIWLLDMFGCDRLGGSLIRRMILRNNSERKRSGPTTLAINESYLSADDILIFSNHKLCDRAEIIALAMTLECSSEDQLQSPDVAEAA